MNNLGNMCYCYNEDCNQQEWERRGNTGKRKYTVISELWIKHLFKTKFKQPVCPYCKEKMIATANIDSSI